MLSHLHYFFILLYILFIPILDLKYSKEIQTIEGAKVGDCICLCEPKELNAIRWVFDGNNPNNFLPRALISHPKQEDCKKECKGWALSFYETSEKAINSFSEKCKHTRNIYKYLGTHIAEIKIEKTDGVNSKIELDGHFSHFEYLDTDFPKKIGVIKKVYP
jgi:hypothetical protein